MQVSRAQNAYQAAGESIPAFSPVQSYLRELQVNISVLRAKESLYSTSYASLSIWTQ